MWCDLFLLYWHPNKSNSHFPAIRSRFIAMSSEKKYSAQGYTNTIAWQNREQHRTKHSINKPLLLWLTSNVPVVSSALRTLKPVNFFNDVCAYASPLLGQRSPLHWDCGSCFCNHMILVKIHISFILFHKTVHHKTLGFIKIRSMCEYRPFPASLSNLNTTSLAGTQKSTNEVLG